jgi:hypothetical protein
MLFQNVKQYGGSAKSTGIYSFLSDSDNWNKKCGICTESDLSTACFVEPRAKRSKENEISTEVVIGKPNKPHVVDAEG